MKKIYITVIFILQLVLILFKLLGYIEIDWIWVFIPIYITIFFLIIGILIFLIIGIILIKFYEDDKKYQ